MIPQKVHQTVFGLRVLGVDVAATRPHISLQY